MDEERRNLENIRVLAILYSTSALAAFLPCGFILIYIYALNAKTYWEAILVCALAAPLVLHAAQILLGILLLNSTRSSTRHLAKCRIWCSAAEFMRALTLVELVALFLWDSHMWWFKAAVFCGYGVQYVIRASGIRILQRSMENLTMRIPRSNARAPEGGGATLTLSNGSTEHLTTSNSASASSPPGTFVSRAPAWTSITVVATVWERETPPPSYREATLAAACVTDGACAVPDLNTRVVADAEAEELEDPPNYQELPQEEGSEN